MSVFGKNKDKNENAFGEQLPDDEEMEQPATDPELADLDSLREEADAGDAAAEDEEAPVYAAYFYDSDGVEQLIADDMTLGEAYIAGKEVGDAARGYKVVDPDGVVLYSHSH